MSEHHGGSDEPPPLYAVPPPDDEPYPAMTTRTPPHSRDAEAAVLGAVLVSPSAFNDVQPILEAGDFYRPEHELIYDAAITLYAAGVPVDAVTVAEHLAKHGDLARAGGAAHIAHLIFNAPADATAAWHARTVADYATRRRLVRAGERIAQLGYADTAADAAELSQTAAAELAQATPTHTVGTVSTWTPVDLDAILDGTLVEHPPTLLSRADGACLLYAGAVHSLAGEPESGKSWIAVHATVQEISEGRAVAFLDFEDRAARVIARLLAAGAHPDAIRAHFRYVRPEVALSAATSHHLGRAVDGTSLVVVDGITEAMTLHGLSLLDNEDIARWLALLPRRIADTGAAVLQIDHVVKNPEMRGRYALGGQHKLAGIDGAAYKITVTEPFGRGKKGHARITVDKDREGHVRAVALGYTVATLTLDSRATERHSASELRVYLDPPTVDLGPDGAFRPTHLMESVSRYIEANPGMSGRVITDFIKGNAQAVRMAMQTLINEGYVRTEPGPKRAVLHFVERPFREDDE